MAWVRLWFGLLGRTLRHPSLAIALARVAWRFRRRGWYARFPFLPLPSREYLRWRMHTAYGRDDAVPPAGDIARYARWATRES